MPRHDSIFGLPISVAELVKFSSRDREGVLIRKDFRPLPDGRGSNLHKLGATELRRRVAPRLAELKTQQAPNRQMVRVPVLMKLIPRVAA